MTEDEYKAAKQDYEDNRKKVIEEYNELDKQFAKVSKEYFKSLMSLDCGEYYIIDLNHVFDQRIYFKWNEHCSIEFKEDIDEFRFSIDKAIVIHKGDIGIYQGYTYHISPDRIINQLHKIKSSTIEDVIAYVKQRIKDF